MAQEPRIHPIGKEANKRFADNWDFMEKNTKALRKKQAAEAKLKKESNNAK